MYDHCPVVIAELTDNPHKFLEKINKAVYGAKKYYKEP
jgi:hypothetical protein